SKATCSSHAAGDTHPFFTVTVPLRLLLLAFVCTLLDGFTLPDGLTLEWWRHYYLQGGIGPPTGVTPACLARFCHRRPGRSGPRGCQPRLPNWHTRLSPRFGTAASRPGTPVHCVAGRDRGPVFTRSQ